MVWGYFFSLLPEAGIRGLRFPRAGLPGNSRLRDIRRLGFPLTVVSGSRS